MGFDIRLLESLLLHGLGGCTVLVTSVAKMVRGGMSFAKMRDTRTGNALHPKPLSGWKKHLSKTTMQK